MSRPPAWLRPDAAAQMVLNFVDAGDNNDELAAMVAAEGATAADLLDALIALLGETDHGRQVLTDATTKHAALMIPAAAIEAALAQLDTVKADLAIALKGHVA